MFGLFKKKDPLKALQKQYADLQQKSFDMSTKDRAASDKLKAEAEEIAKQIEALRQFLRYHDEVAEQVLRIL